MLIRGFTRRHVGYATLSRSTRKLDELVRRPNLSLYPRWTGDSMSQTTAASTAQADLLKISILGKDSIHVGYHLLPHIFHTILTTLPSSAYVLITDTTLEGLYGDKVREAFADAQKELGLEKRLLVYHVSPGETAKSRRVKEAIEDWMLEQRLTRDTVLLAFGGGVIGDLAGFVAATFMRGIKFVQIPTTLLAMVDSSVGGKTAVDTPHGKNLIGAFWQPSYVFVDLAFLSSLPQREFSNGMAEVVKTAAIWVEEDFASLESKAEEIISAITQSSSSVENPHIGRHISTRTVAQGLLLKVVSGSIFVKSHIVTLDERETGLRNLVNFGHTIGHAIEAVLTPDMLHGECVSVGIILEAEVARLLGHLGQVAVGRLARCLKAYGLPISLTDPKITKLAAYPQITVDKLLDIMKIDKKNSGPKKKIVILSRIGKTLEEKATEVSDDIIRKVLCESATVVPGIPRNSPVTMATPGSKSISNRALVLAALASGECRLRNLLHSDDTAVMMNALVDLKGAEFSWEDGGETLVVKGGQGSLTPPSNDKHLYLGNAGTAARFLTTVCAIARSDDKAASTVITGNARMKQRPVGPLVDALAANGSSIDYVESTGSLPLRIGASGLKGGKIQLAASVSSQYVSSILLCAPYAVEPVTLELTGGQVISQPYIDMTIAMMKEFGIQVRRAADSTGKLLDVYEIPRGVYVNPAIYNVESDASSATYPLAIAAITGTTCTIANIGSASLQGDAGFAKGVLEPMGCTVVQTATETTVTGPPIGTLKALGHVDMEPMTDAFLTASVLAAVATRPADPERQVEGKPLDSRIFGIANQRVKECNRIKAMRDELAKFGVKTDEFDDGIIISGQPIDTLKTGAEVHCYDDHRVAMAFSVLACTVKGTVLDEKRCVAKTWPNWWDDLQNKIGIDFDGVELSAPHAEASTSGSALTGKPANASVFVIGMRGAGKTYIGALGAAALGWTFLDADDYFVEQTGKTVTDFVAANGWPAFRETEAGHLETFLRDHATGYVISLGGGIVETPSARETLAKYAGAGGPVVHVTRPIEDISRYLEALADTTSRPAWGEPIADVFTRRKPWFKQCSLYDFHNTYNTSLTAPSSDGLRAEVARFFKFVTGIDTNRPRLSRANPTAFLSLTFPDVSIALESIDEISAGADAIELRVDLLSESGSAAKSNPSHAYVASQVMLLRQHTTLPIVYSVRTAAQGGASPDDKPEEYLELVNLGLRLACEYVDLEVALPEDKLAPIVNNKHESHIIASWHDWSGAMKWDSDEVQEKLALCARIGDVAKIVGKATSAHDNTVLSAFVAGYASQRNSKPLLAINMGAEGQLSRILNPILTPITHEKLPVRAAPGQLTAKQINQARHLIGQLSAQKFFLFGTPIAHSVSPALHNAGFEVLGLPHVYGRHETGEFDAGALEVLNDPEFGGASVTIPLKLDIIPHLGSISKEAEAIGAVNTVIVQQVDGKRSLHGDNTDWQAIHLLASAGLPSNAPPPSQLKGLVIGAGGTCRAAVYALHQLGVSTIYLFNRTRANADKLKASLPSEYNVEVVESLSALPSAPSVIVSTVPGDSLTLDSSSPGIAIDDSLLAATHGGVAIDMAYKPRMTPLLKLAEAKQGWTAVPGVKILCEQGYKQFEAWTAKRAPKRAMHDAVMAKYNA